MAYASLRWLSPLRLFCLRRRGSVSIEHLNARWLIAFRSANTNTAVGGCPAGTSHDVITITEDITLSEPLPPITGTITIEGGGHTISGDGKFRIFDVNGGRLTLKNLTLEKGKATEGSGGFTYIINNEHVLVDAGGALRLDGGAQVLIENTTLSGNSADAGGAIALLSGKLSGDNSSFVGNTSSEYDGGAILLGQGAVTITNSSFVDNSAVWTGGALGVQSGSISVANSTFQDNVGPAGGGVLYMGGGDATLAHVTMLNNRAMGGGDSVANSGGVIKLRNSVIAGRGGGEDCIGGLTQNIGNWSEDGTCAFTASDTPLLGKLTGSPAYLPLLDGSPLLDAADARFCTNTDQLGTPRTQGGGCDIGAIESTTALPAPAPVVPPPPCPLALQITAANTDAPGWWMPGWQRARCHHFERGHQPRRSAARNQEQDYNRGQWLHDKRRKTIPHLLRRWRGSGPLRSEADRGQVDKSRRRLTRGERRKGNHREFKIHQELCRYRRWRDCDQLSQPRSGHQQQRIQKQLCAMVWGRYRYERRYDHHYE